MESYLNLIRDVLTNGERKEQRAKLKGTEPVRTIGIFGAGPIRCDLADGFPLLTTKRIQFKAVAKELLWFLRGETNIKTLGVRIWDEWADENGELGPIYGQQWRRWKTPDGGTIDQIATLIADIRAVMDNPSHSAGRRLILCSWNPAAISRIPKAPPFCHTLAQFSVANGRLSCHLYQRSADLFLGVPFNIASYALLTHLLANVVGLAPGRHIHSFGDAHVYENHLEEMGTQLARRPKKLPTLNIDQRLADLDNVPIESLKLDGYDPYPALRGEVAV